MMDEGQRGMGVVPEDQDLDWVALLRADVEPAKPIRFRHRVGRVPRDMMMGGTPYLLLISDTFVSVLETHAFTGWTTYPVEVRRKRGEVIPGYSGLAITGRSRPIPDADPGAASAGVVELAALVRRTWGGSDLYLGGDSGGIVVTKRVRDALRAAHVSNVTFTRVG
jgi:hypothetical protein